MSGEPDVDERALPRLERMVGRDVVEEVLDLYLKQSPRRLAGVRDGLARGSADEAARALHDLKSSAGMVGAVAVQRLAEEMEHLARADDLSALHDRLERLERLVLDSDRALAEARAKLGG